MLPQTTRETTFENSNARTRESDSRRGGGLFGHWALIQCFHLKLAFRSVDAYDEMLLRGRSHRKPATSIIIIQSKQRNESNTSTRKHRREVFRR